MRRRAGLAAAAQAGLLVLAAAGLAGCSRRAPVYDGRAEAALVLRLGGKVVLRDVVTPVAVEAALPAEGAVDVVRIDLSARGRYVNDYVLQQLAGLETLEELVLQESQITDQGLAHLAGMKKLRVLDLYRCRITDAGCAALGALTSLEKLELSYTLVTDAGLDPLHGLKKLKSLHLNGTQVSPDAIARLKRAIPACEVIKY